MGEGKGKRDGRKDRREGEGQEREKEGKGKEREKRRERERKKKAKYGEMFRPLHFFLRAPLGGDALVPVPLARGKSFKVFLTSYRLRYGYLKLQTPLKDTDT